MRTKRGRIRNELVLGLAAVVVLSSLVTYAAALISFRRGFDVLVEKNDIQIAQSYASDLASYYAERGSWEGVATRVEQLRQTVTLPPRGEVQDQRVPDKRHGGEFDIPLILTDAKGGKIFDGSRGKEVDAKGQDKLRVADGVKVSVRGSTVGYVFFKSMLVRSYNAQESAFLRSLTATTGASVFFGLILALAAGTALASRFAKPIVALDGAVKEIAEGNLTARVAVRRRDELGSLADSFNAMADRLKSTEAARQNLLADTAHELRTPVSVIQANLEMIIDGVYAADSDRIQSLYEETKVLTSLIADLRTLSDLEVGAAPVKIGTVNLSGLIEESCQRLAPLFAEKGMSLEAAPMDDLGTGAELCVLADEERLRQVVRNMAVNAKKYGEPGSSVRIGVEALEAKGSVRVTIADQGPGVPEAELENIFDRFYRVDASRNRESGGRGLGLAICKKIVESLGGTIGAYNLEPHGLAVWFEVPALRG